jgi:hypothetical protein
MRNYLISCTLTRFTNKAVYPLQGPKKNFGTVLLNICQIRNILHKIVNISNIDDEAVFRSKAVIQ